ncbi:hypothetical protein ACZ87_03853 [Candidatus Erwinia dacicola]|uniref:Uncharacterized protein n=1 Tax=Candidatus Erwinia dacicola TaxID=252393 RepID=A0A328TH97_9GAMM|nr:hypothetical protein ACZ87_03853 [Candidatus Erwinia dacicola]
MLALNSVRTVGHIAALDLVRCGNCEPAVEMIRYFNVPVTGTLVLVLPAEPPLAFHASIT